MPARWTVLASGSGGNASLLQLNGAGLLVDIGSTTTDIIPLRDGLVRAAGYTDSERLACGELVYTGLTRSFVMALAERAPFAGRWTTLAAEYFASAADVNRVAGEQNPAAGQVYQQRAFSRRMSGSKQKLKAPVAEEIEILIELEPMRRS